MCAICILLDTFDKNVYFMYNSVKMKINGIKLLSIGEAADYLGVAKTTLRRWHKAGNFRATFVSPGKHLYYSITDLEKKTMGIAKSAFNWANSNEPFTPPADWYCPTSDIFKTRLERMNGELLARPAQEPIASLIASAAGEIGNNSYDHNLGNWPDVPGTLFSYDLGKRVIVLADRGVGILATLRRIKPELITHHEALNIAFTKIITGRAPEHRGNGLKYVRKALAQAGARLQFQSGDAQLKLLGNADEDRLQISTTDTPTRGCFAVIHY